MKAIHAIWWGIKIGLALFALVALAQTIALLPSISHSLSVIAEKLQ